MAVNAVSLQIQHAQHLQQTCAKRERRLQLLRSWLRARGEGMLLLEKPDGLSTVLRALKECEVGGDSSRLTLVHTLVRKRPCSWYAACMCCVLLHQEVQEKLPLKSAELQELRDCLFPRDDLGPPGGDGDFASQVDAVGEELTELRHQVASRIQVSFSQLLPR